MPTGYRVVLLVVALVSVVAIGMAGRALYQISRECLKQCEWGDKRCSEMCDKRHYCPAHPSE